MVEGMADGEGGRRRVDGRVVACLDTSPAARPVLEAAVRLADLTGRTVEAVHVRSEDGRSFETVESLAARAGLPLTVLEPPIESALVDHLRRDDVAAGVLSARSTTSGRRPAGQITRHVIERCSLPLLVVPPEVVAPRAFHRAVVPLEGDSISSDAVARRALPLLGGEVELVVLHVFTKETTPRMLDRPIRDMVMLAEDFVVRHLPGALCAELRIGSVASQVVELAKVEDADLLVLSWSQRAEPGRAQTVMDVLSSASVPVLLVPDTRAAPGS